MIDPEIIWDRDDEPDGNVQHIAEHGVGVEEVLRSPETRTGRSRSSGRPQAFGWTSTGKFITVIWEEVLDDLPHHRLRSPAARGEAKMSKTHDKPALSAEQRAAIEAIRERSRKERPGPDELIDRGELDELVPQTQYLEVRALGVKFRRIREGKGLSLTDLSERSGLTRAAISRLENGWNLNPTLETLFRFAEALGVDLRLTADDPSESGKED